MKVLLLDTPHAMLDEVLDIHLSTVNGKLRLTWADGSADI